MANSKDNITDDGFPGEKYYNKTSLIIYAVVIALIILEKDSSKDILDIVVVTVFTVIWTYGTGLVAFIIIKAAILVVAKDSVLDKTITQYVAWLAPAIGFGLFAYITWG